MHGDDERDDGDLDGRYRQDEEDHEHEDGGHGHGGHSHDHTSASRQALVIALAINTAFLVVEVAGALLADSLALLADAVHMLTDSASLGLALFAALVATRPADSRRTFGYHRAEVIGALVNGLLLIAAVGYVLVVADGVDRDAVLAGCRSDLAERFGIDHATVQVESAEFAETVELDCYPATAG